MDHGRLQRYRRSPGYCVGEVGVQTNIVSKTGGQAERNEEKVLG